jgi:hypothetical protein
MHAYSMGLIYWWSRLASTMPGIANVMTQTPGVSEVVEGLGGIDVRRKMPPFATQTFTDWFRKRPTKNLKNVGKTKILLWPDAFNNYFFPETAAAAVEVLEAAGFNVTIPSRPLCCGRPLYDFGMLILHESRQGELTHFHHIPHTPYYGTAGRSSRRSRPANYKGTCSMPSYGWPRRSTNSMSRVTPRNCVPHGAQSE